MAAPAQDEGRSPGVGENAIDPRVPPPAIGVGEQEDVLQPVEVPVGGGVTAHQHGLQEGVPLGDGQRTLTTLVPLEGWGAEEAPQHPQAPAARNATTQASEEERKL